MPQYLTYLLEPVQVYPCPKIPTNNLCSICFIRESVMGLHKLAAIHLSWWSGQMGERQTLWAAPGHAASLSLFSSLLEGEENPFILVKFVYEEKDNDVVFQVFPPHVTSPLSLSWPGHPLSFHLFRALLSLFGITTVLGHVQNLSSRCRSNAPLLKPLSALPLQSHNMSFACCRTNTHPGLRFRSGLHNHLSHPAALQLSSRWG